MKSGETMLRKIGCAAAVAAMVAVAGCSDSIDVGEGRLFPSTASCSADETRQGDECVPAVHPCTTLHRVVLADGSCGDCRDGFAPLNDQCVESVSPAGGSVEPTEPGLPGSPDGPVPGTEPQPGMAGGGDEETDTAENGGGGTTTPAQGTNVTFEPITDDPQTSTPQLTNSYGYSSSWTNLIAGSHGGTETAESSSDWEDGSDLDVLGLGTGSHMAVALSDDGIAVMVKVQRRTEVYYRILDVHNRKQIGHWKRIPFEQGQLYAAPSVAIRPDGKSFVIAVERLLGAGQAHRNPDNPVEDVRYIKYTRSSMDPRSYTPTEVHVIEGNDVQLTLPKVLCNSDGVFGIAGIKFWEESLPNNVPGFIWFEKVVFGILSFDESIQLDVVNDDHVRVVSDIMRVSLPVSSVTDAEDNLEATSVGPNFYLAFRHQTYHRYRFTNISINTMPPREHLHILRQNDPHVPLPNGWHQTRDFEDFTSAIAGVLTEEGNAGFLRARKCFDNKNTLCFEDSADKWDELVISGFYDQKHTPAMAVFQKDEKLYVVLEGNYEIVELFSIAKEDSQRSLSSLTLRYFQNTRPSRVEIVANRHGEILALWMTDVPDSDDNLLGGMTSRVP